MKHLPVTVYSVLDTVPPERKIFLYRNDQHIWVTDRYPHHMHGHPELAYTHWADIPEGWPWYPVKPKEM